MDERPRLIEKENDGSLSLNGIKNYLNETERLIKGKIFSTEDDYNYYIKDKQFIATRCNESSYGKKFDETISITTDEKNFVRISFVRTAQSKKKEKVYKSIYQHITEFHYDRQHVKVMKGQNYADTLEDTITKKISSGFIKEGVYTEYQSIDEMKNDISRITECDYSLFQMIPLYSNLMTPEEKKDYKERLKTASIKFKEKQDSDSLIYNLYERYITNKEKENRKQVKVLALKKSS